MKESLRACDFRLFGRKEERPLCLYLFSEKIAEEAAGPDQTFSSLRNQEESHEDRAAQE
jgi:hypothetical protein